MSRSRSATPSSRDTGLFASQPEALVISEGQISSDTTHVLDDLLDGLNHGHNEEPTMVDEPDRTDDTALAEELRARANLPWYKRPSAYWILAFVPFSAIAMTATLAPRLAIYTQLACSVYRPEFDTVDAPSLFSSLVGSQLYTLALSAPFYSPSPTHFTGTTDPRCASDPVVLAAVAKLTGAMTTVMGILSCLTTAWWGALGDRHGRTFVLGMAVVGVLITDYNFIFVSNFFRILPGGYWFLLLGPTIEGCLGGFSAIVAANQAYMADCTSPQARSRIFSTSLGLMFTGLAIGPTFGGLLIKHTGDTLSVFYVAAAIHSVFAILVWFVIPESNPLAQQRASILKWKTEMASNGNGHTSMFKRLFGFLTPLAIFIPPKVQEGSPLKSKGRNWGFTLLVLAYGISVTVMGSYSYKFLFATSEFGWTTEELGYFMSVIGVSRAVYLIIVLPMAIKYLQPRFYPAIQLPIGNAEPLSGQGTSPDILQDAPSPPKRSQHSPAFDLALTRASLFIDVISYAGIALVPRPMAFVGFTLLSGLGSGFAPALQSVALHLYSQTSHPENGKMFGAMSVVQAISSQVIGPAGYALLYVETVEKFPRAIFFASAFSFTTTFILICFVRLPRPHVVDTEASPPLASSGSIEREETLVSDEASAAPKLVPTIVISSSQ